MKILVVASGFAQASRGPIQMMTEAGFEVEELDYGPAGLNKLEDEFCRIVQGVDGLIVTALELVTRRVFDHAAALKMVAIRSAGFEGTDLRAATDHGVLVTHNPGANRQAVADMAMGLMLSVARGIGWMDRGMRQGRYNELRRKTKDIYRKTLGIIGLGRIGKAVAERARGFDMKILYHDIVAYAEFADARGIEKVPMDRLLQEADVVTLHVPVDDTTRGMLGGGEVDRMKPGAILINTARGGIVDERAIYDALVRGRLYGYGTDVHAEEPPVWHDLIRLENVVSTPHMAGTSEEGLLNMARETAKKTIQFLRDGVIPADVLNPEVLGKLGRST
jgi:phosphoglycerate dehydrogenase-like enzyme